MATKTTKKKPKTTVKSNTNQFDDIESRMIPVGDIPVYLKIVAYGRSGSGKTTFTGTFPTPHLVLDVREKGTTSIRKRKGTIVLPITKWEDYEEAYWYLSVNPKGFKTVTIDGVTGLQDMALAYYNGGDIGQTSRRTYGFAASLMKTWILLYRDLEMNVIFTAQDRESSSDEIEEGGDIFPEVGPYVMPSVAKILNAAVDIIGQTYIREVEKKVKIKGKVQTKEVKEYCMRIGPHARYLTKFRTDTGGDGKILVPQSIVNPSFEKLLELTLNEDD